MSQTIKMLLEGRKVLFKLEHLIKEKNETTVQLLTSLSYR